MEIYTIVNLLEVIPRLRERMLENIIKILLVVSSSTSGSTRQVLKGPKSWARHHSFNISDAPNMSEHIIDSTSCGSGEREHRLRPSEFAHFEQMVVVSSNFHLCSVIS